MSSILGALAMLVSLAVVFFGLTSQAWKNYKRKTCEGLSITLILVTLLAYSVWLAYGISKPDWFLIASQTPGVIMGLIILSQYLVYDSKKKKS
ncbi:MAG TPA: SemiSWEET family transporter [Candidatus Paceibacterota bacterium]|nr:SemiSWEET family transporter [Candidatus Paceibacterota bacterium]HRZ34492.1 SemiSWEET family transporter [Candidatus Paceibacterota bacterium]